MAIWSVNYTRGSIARNSKTNLAQNNQVLRRPFPDSSLEIKLVSYIDGTHFPNGLSQVSVRSVSAFSNPSGVPINYDGELEFYWYETDTSENPYAGSYGEFAPHIYNANQALAITSIGNVLIAELIVDNVGQLAIRSFGELHITCSRRNWVQWSNIGAVNFTEGLDNIAGERPMEWSGLVYKIIKLDKKVVVYGENGVSVMIPHDVNYGLTTILTHGLKGRDAVVGTEFIHYFINSIGQLYYFGERLEKLGYEEYLSKMVDPVLSYDQVNELLYICDGIYGYVYSYLERSMGEGPVNITGIGYKDSEYFISSYAPVTIPNFELWTDILDFGTRNAKTLHSIEIGTNLNGELLVSAEFRMDKGKDFIRLPWVRTNPAGIASLICHGREFRIGVKVNSYEYFEVDYIEIEGRIT